jgi:hypothetical protein
LIPIEGIILGPYAGIVSAFIGSTVSRAIKPTDLWMFGIIAEPIGVLASGLLAKRSWKPLTVLYALMLAAYFIHPFGTWFPIWTILDVLIGLILIYPICKLFKSPYMEEPKRLTILIPMIAFISIVTDALARIFLLIPVRLYELLAWTPEVVYYIFLFGAIDSFVEDILVVAVSFIVGIPLLMALKKIPSFKFPMT